MVSTTQAYSTVKGILSAYGGAIVSGRSSLKEGLDHDGDPFEPLQNHVSTLYSIAAMPCYPAGNIVFGIEWVTYRLEQDYQMVVQLEKGKTRLATAFIGLQYGVVREVNISPKAKGHLDDLASIRGMGLEEGVKRLFEKICQKGAYLTVNIA